MLSIVARNIEIAEVPKVECRILNLRQSDPVCCKRCIQKTSSMHNNYDSDSYKMQTARGANALRAKCWQANELLGQHNAKLTWQ